MLVEILASRMSLFAWVDVLVSAVVLIAFIRHEGRRASIPGLWVPIAGTGADDQGVGIARGEAFGHRTGAPITIDLILELKGERWAIEMKLRGHIHPPAPCPVRKTPCPQTCRPSPGIMGAMNHDDLSKLERVGTSSVDKHAKQG